MLHRRGHSLEPADRAQADVEVQLLAQCDVQRAYSAADGRGQRSLYADEKFAERLKSLGRQPLAFAIDLQSLFPGIDLHPRNAALAAVCLFDGGVPHGHGRAGYVRSGAVALDEWHHWKVGDVQPGGGHRDFLALGDLYFVVVHGNDVLNAFVLKKWREGGGGEKKRSRPAVRWRVGEGTRFPSSLRMKSGFPASGKRQEVAFAYRVVLSDDSRICLADVAVAGGVAIHALGNPEKSVSALHPISARPGA